MKIQFYAKLLREECKHYNSLVGYILVFMSLLLLQNTMQGRAMDLTHMAEEDSVKVLVQQRHRTSAGIPILGEENNFRILTPQTLDADAETLMNKWNKAYGKNTFIQSAAPSLSGNFEEVRRKKLENLPTAIDMQYNAYVKRSMDLFMKGKKYFIPTMLSLGEFYFPVIETIFDRYDIPLELKYLAVVESGLDPTVASYSGAKGMWQFMLVTAKAYGLEVNSVVDERMDVYKSTEAAARHFKDLYQIYGDWLVCIAAYNAGVGNVNKAIRRSGGKVNFWAMYNQLPRQTRDYVPLFIATYYAMEYHQDYNFRRANFVMPRDLDTLYISERKTIADIAREAEVTESFFRLINPQFKGSYIPGNLRKYAILLPLSAISRLDKAMHRVDLGKETPSGAPNEKKRHLAMVPPAIQEPSSPSRSYTIRRGDSLYKIAKRHGVSIKALMAANNITSTNYKLIPGKSIEIPE